MKPYIECFEQKKWIILTFFLFLVFFLLIHPLYIFDTDDWINIGRERPLYPSHYYFNPIKVLPEILYPLISVSSVRILYPLTGDFVGSIGGGGTALIYSGILTVNSILIYKLLTYFKLITVANNNDKVLLFISTIVIVLSFFYFGKNGNYLLKEVNVTCIYHYTIPAFLNISVVLFLMNHEAQGKQILCLNNSYLNFILIICLYLCIFSNLFINCVLLSYASFIILNCSVQEFRNKISTKDFFISVLKGNYQYLLLIVVWGLSAYLESKGGRAASLGIKAPFTFNRVEQAFSYFFSTTIDAIGIKKAHIILLLACTALANLALIRKILTKKIQNQDKTFLYNQIMLCWMISFIIFYQILLSVKTDCWYQQRSSVMLCWFIWILLEFFLCLFYINRFISHISAFVSLILIILSCNLLIQKPVFEETNMLPNTNILAVKKFSNDIVDRLKKAEQQEFTELKLQVPNFKRNDNWPLGVYAGDAIANTLRKHGIIKRKLKVVIVPDNQMNKYYSLP